VKPQADPIRGDLLEVHWIDIQEDSTGDPNQAYLGARVSYGLFWDRKQDKGVDVLVTTTTIDPEPENQGWCCYPVTCVTRLRVVRRARRPRQRKEPKS
jgi:hypothetical protein